MAPLVGGACTSWWALRGSVGPKELWALNSVGTEECWHRGSAVTKKCGTRWHYGVVLRSAGTKECRG